jgi:hypothetical protein
MNNTLSKLNGISVCVGFLISLEMKNEERRKKTNKVRSEIAKPAENGSKREESKENKRKPCTYFFILQQTYSLKQ